MVWPRKSGRECINLSACGNAKFNFPLSGPAQPFQRANPFYRELVKQPKIKNIAVVQYKFCVPKFYHGGLQTTGFALIFQQKTGFAVIAKLQLFLLLQKFNFPPSENVLAQMPREFWCY